MRVLVFGATGQVAVELQRQAEAFGAEITALDRDQADLIDPARCSAAVVASDAEVVINAAAYTAVDKAEDEEGLARIINGESPGAMARAAAIMGIPFLHISTDYVFDGSGKRAWIPSDPTAPINAYGRTKLLGERAVAEAGGNWAVLRTSWVFSAHGTNFAKTMLRLAETRDALSVVDDQVGGPTPAADIAAALLTMARAMVGGQSGGVYHFGGTPEVSWAGFAREIFEQAGRDVTVTGIPTTQYPTPAQRPLNSRLDCATLTSDFGIKPADWKVGLATVLNDLKDA